MNKYIKIKIIILSLIAAIAVVIFFLGNKVAYAQTYYEDSVETQNNNVGTGPVSARTTCAYPDKSGHII